jgi:hypothetical protein
VAGRAGGCVGFAAGKVLGVQGFAALGRESAKGGLAALAALAYCVSWSSRTPAWLVLESTMAKPARIAEMFSLSGMESSLKR